MSEEKIVRASPEAQHTCPCGEPADVMIETNGGAPSYACDEHEMSVRLAALRGRRTADDSTDLPGPDEVCGCSQGYKRGMCPVCGPAEDQSASPADRDEFWEQDSTDGCDCGAFEGGEHTRLCASVGATRLRAAQNARCTASASADDGDNWADGMRQAASVVRAEVAQHPGTVSAVLLASLAAQLDGLADHYPGERERRSASAPAVSDVVEVIARADGRFGWLGEATHRDSAGVTVRFFYDHTSRLYRADEVKPFEQRPSNVPSEVAVPWAKLWLDTHVGTSSPASERALDLLVESRTGSASHAFRGVFTCEFCHRPKADHCEAVARVSYLRARFGARPDEPFASFADRLAADRGTGSPSPCLACGAPSPPHAELCVEHLTLSRDEAEAFATSAAKVGDRLALLKEARRRIRAIEIKTAHAYALGLAIGVLYQMRDELQAAPCAPAACTCGAPRGADHGITCPAGRSDTPGEADPKAGLEHPPMCTCDVCWPPSRVTDSSSSDRDRAGAWLLPVWRDMPNSTYTPTLLKLAALLADVRRETIEACIHIVERDLSTNVTKYLVAQFTRVAPGDASKEKP